MKRAEKLLASLDLTTARGYRSVDTASGERWVETRFRTALGRDYLAAESAVRGATIAGLQTFLRAQSRRLTETREGMESQSLLCILDAWWPLQAMPLSTSGEAPFVTFISSRAA